MTVEFPVQPVSGTAGITLPPVLVDVSDRSVVWSGLNVHLTLIRVGKRSRGHLMRGSIVHVKTVGGIATFRHLAISARPVCAESDGGPQACGFGRI